VLPLRALEVLEYLESDGQSPYAKWFDSLNPPAAAKVAIAATRLSQGNFSNVKGVGGGVHEYRIDVGPGYRMYFGKDGERVVLLHGGGTRSDSSETLQPPAAAGKTIRAEKNRRFDSGSHSRF
jgi:putative addiction module killer protein